MEVHAFVPAGHLKSLSSRGFELSRRDLGFDCDGNAGVNGYDRSTNMVSGYSVRVDSSASWESGSEKSFKLPLPPCRYGSTEVSGGSSRKCQYSGKNFSPSSVLIFLTPWIGCCDSRDAISSFCRKIASADTVEIVSF